MASTVVDRPSNRPLDGFDVRLIEQQQSEEVQLLVGKSSTAVPYHQVKSLLCSPPGSQVTKPSRRNRVIPRPDLEPVRILLGKAGKVCVFSCQLKWPRLIIVRLLHWSHFPSRILMFKEEL